MPEKISFNTESDTVFDVQVGDQKVSEFVQNSRDDQAENLRLIRREQNVARREEEKLSSESQRLKNRLFGVFRSKDDAKHPEAILSLARKFGLEADAKKLQAKSERDLFQGELNKKVANLIRERVIHNLTAANDCAQREGEGCNLFKEVSVGDVYNILCSDLEDLDNETLTNVCNTAKIGFYNIAVHLKKMRYVQSEAPKNYEKKEYSAEKFIDDILEAEVQSGFILAQSKPDFLLKILNNVPREYTTENLTEILKKLVFSLDEHQLANIHDSLIEKLYSEDPAKISSIMLGALDAYLLGEEMKLNPHNEHSLLTDKGALVGILSFLKVPELRDAANIKIAEYIGNRFGILNPMNMVDTWQQNNPDLSSWFKENIEMMKRLAEKNPEGPKLLASFYGIHLFSRYPFRVLEAQIKNHDAHGSYGLMIHAYNDHNGAFERRYRYLYDELFADTEGKDMLRIVETGNVRDLLRIFVSLREKFYEETDKIRFATVVAHGSPSSISLSGGLEHGVPQINKAKYADLFRSDVRKSTSLSGGIKDLFTDDAMVVFASCSTGVQNGIAQMFSEKTGLHIVAPKVDTTIASLHATYEDGKPRLEVKYIAELEDHASFSAGEELRT